MNNMTMTQLFAEYLDLKDVALQTILNRLANPIVLNSVEYRGSLVSLDFKTNSIVLSLTEDDKVSTTQTMAFEDFDKLTEPHIYTIHFYKGIEAFGQVLEHFRTVEVSFFVEPKSENIIIQKGLEMISGYPKSYTAKVYKKGHLEDIVEDMIATEDNLWNLSE